MHFRILFSHDILRNILKKLPNDVMINFNHFTEIHKKIPIYAVHIFPFCKRYKYFCLKKKKINKAYQRHAERSLLHFFRIIHESIIFFISQYILLSQFFHHLLYISKAISHKHMYIHIYI